MYRFFFTTTLYVFVLFVIVTSFIFTIAFAATPKGNNKLKCSEADKNDADLTVARIMTFGRSDRRFPENVSEMKKYCR